MSEILLGILAYLGFGGLAHAATATGQEDPPWKLLAGIAVAGAILGLGKLLASGEKLTARLIVGRAIVSGGLAVGAGSVLTFFPSLPTTALCGIAAVSAVLGEQFLERFINAKLDGK